MGILSKHLSPDERAKKRRDDFNKVEELLLMLGKRKVAEACRVANVPRGTYYHLRSKLADYQRLNFRDRRVGRLDGFEKRLDDHLEKAGASQINRSCERLAAGMTLAGESVPSRETVRRFLRRKDARFVRGLDYQHGRWYSKDDNFLRRFGSRILSGQRNPQLKSEARARSSITGSVTREETAQEKESCRERVKRGKRNLDRLNLKGAIANLVASNRESFLSLILREGAEILREGPSLLLERSNDGAGCSRRVRIESDSRSWICPSHKVLTLAYRLSGTAKYQWAEVGFRGELPISDIAVDGNVESAHQRAARAFVRTENWPQWASVLQSDLEQRFSRLVQENLKTGEPLAAPPDGWQEIEDTLREYYYGKLANAFANATRRLLEVELKQHVNAVAASDLAQLFSELGDTQRAEPLPAAPLGLRSLFWVTDVRKKMSATWLFRPSQIRTPGHPGARQRDKLSANMYATRSELVDYLKQHGRVSPRLGCHASARELVEHLERQGIPGEELLIAGLTALRDRLLRARQVKA